MTFFDILVALLLTWFLSRWISAVKETNKLEREVDQKISELKEHALKMKLETHQGCWYAWRAVDHKFMGQAPTRSECLAEVARRIGLPDPNFLIVIEEK